MISAQFVGFQPGRAHKHSILAGMPPIGFRRGCVELRSEGKRRRVLVLEDHPGIASALERLFRFWQVDVLGPFSRVADAEPVLRSQQVDAVVLDLVLADSGALETAERVIGLVGAHSVVVFSAMTELIDRLEERHGPLMHVQKGDAPALLGALERMGAIEFPGRTRGEPRGVIGTRLAGGGSAA